MLMTAHFNTFYTCLLLTYYKHLEELDKYSDRPTSQEHSHLKFVADKRNQTVREYLMYLYEGCFFEGDDSMMGLMEFNKDKLNKYCLSLGLKCTTEVYNSLKGANFC